MVAKKSYEFLSHTADVKFRAYGKTLEEAFINAAYAMADTVTDHTKITAAVKHKIAVQAEDDKALLYDFLEQFIILLDAENFLLAEITELDIKKEKGVFALIAKFVGDTKPEKYNINMHIKAMTYQEMEIKKNGSWMVQVVIDI